MHHVGGLGMFPRQDPILARRDPGEEEPGEEGSVETFRETCCMQAHTHAHTHSHKSMYKHISCTYLICYDLYIINMFMSTYRYVVFVQLQTVCVNCFTTCSNTTQLSAISGSNEIVCFVFFCLRRFGLCRYVSNGSNSASTRNTVSHFGFK